MTSIASPTRAATANPFQGFRGDIGGLRGVAVLLVLVSHLGLGFENGFIGVDIFFVISGFLITGLMLKEYDRAISAEQRGRISLSAFYARRARRILPAAVLCLVLTVVAANLLLNAGAAAEVEKDALWSLLFAANIDLIQSSTDYFQQGFQVSPLQNFWSLAVEEQFYVVWPTLVILAISLHGLTIGRSAVRWRSRVLVLVCIVTVASFAWSVASSVSEPAVGYFSTLTRAWELGIGAATACILFMTRRSLSHWWGIAGAVAIVATLALMPADMPFPGWVAAVPVVGTALILASGAGRRTPVSAALDIAPLRFFGLISYSLYLFHWPIIVLFSRFMLDWNMWARTLVLAGASIAVGTLSYYLVEKPSLTYLPRFRFEKEKRKPLALAPRVSTIAATAAIAVAGVVVFVPPAYEQTAYAKGRILEEEARNYTPPPAEPTGVATPSIPTAEELDVLAASWMEQVATAGETTVVPATLTPSLLHLGERKGEQPDLCASGDCRSGNGPLNALLIGNSFADMMYPMVRGALPASVWTVHLKWRSGCQLGVADECPEIFDVAGEDVDLLIISDYAYMNDGIVREARDAKMGVELAKYTAEVPHVVYVGEVPGMERALVDCVNAANRFGDGCRSNRTSVASINELKRSASADAEALFVDPTDWLCDGASCPIIIGNSPTYVDTQHLSAGVSASLAPAFRLRLLPSIKPIEAAAEVSAP